MIKDKDKKFNFFNKTTMLIVGVMLIILLAISLVLFGNSNSKQSTPVTSAKICFVGDYKIGDGAWKPIVKGEHISSTKGDVTLKGNFHWYTPSGEHMGIYKGIEYIAFYTDHINLTFKQSGNSYTIDNENPLYGQSACGENWTAHAFLGGEDIIEIVVHNPHGFGNESAIDQMLSNTAFWGNIQFEKDILEAGKTQRNMGLLFAIASITFLGTALFSSLIHIKNTKFIWLLGLIILFAGIYFTYNSFGISFWSDSIISNTMLLGISMMLYAFFLSMLVTVTLKSLKKVGAITTIALGVDICVLFVLSMVTNVFFYDTWIYWGIVQCLANIVLMVCLVKEFIKANNKEKFIYVCAFFPLLAFDIDLIATLFGAWQVGLISQFAFVLLFAVAVVVLLRIIPSSINAITKAKELETEKILLNTQLTESRVSTMMSQIRPHFIYNTLGSIEQLCELDPPKAGELVHDFAKYLRGNFGELDNPKPILMSQEMQHVHHYINIESVRFPDMTFTFEMNSNDFNIPALTIQPIVENAVKHGLMKLSKGGTIKVVSYETDDSYCVLVEDDGAGFDASKVFDDRKHVGIRNICGRLKAMVGGSLKIESEIGKGTKVLITIPKEASK